MTSSLQSCFLQNIRRQNKEKTLLGQSDQTWPNSITISFNPVDNDRTTNVNSECEVE